MVGTTTDRKAQTARERDALIAEADLQTRAIMRLSAWKRIAYSLLAVGALMAYWNIPGRAVLGPCRGNRHLHRVSVRFCHAPHGGGARQGQRTRDDVRRRDRHGGCPQGRLRGQGLSCRGCELGSFAEERTGGLRHLSVGAQRSPCTPPFEMTS